MTDERIKLLANNLINYSCRLKPGERVLIESIGENDDLVKELIKEAYKVKAMPYVWYNNKAVERELLLGLTEEQIDLKTRIDAEMMSNMQAYIGIRGGSNSSELSDVPGEKLNMFLKRYSSPVHSDIRVAKTKWVVLRYPSPAMAQQANMSTEAFTDYYFNVCNLDYRKMSKAMDSMKALIEKTDKVRIVGPNTDIHFSIKNMPAIKCDGGCNIPDGEIYTAPVDGSIEGVISYNTPALKDGFTFENIVLRFEKGRIVEATANDTARINEIFDMDPGARGVGEFSFGLNPYINTPMKDTLFDEKICGSIHFTPGACYDDCDNGNRSALHWDLVLIQTPEFGGGEIYFDDRLIRKDGRFVIKELDCINGENLM
ncbi:MAG: aminopeptidase [Clostridia bacterium]